MNAVFEYLLWRFSHENTYERWKEETKDFSTPEKYWPDDLKNLAAKFREHIRFVDLTPEGFSDSLTETIEKAFPE